MITTHACNTRSVDRSDSYGGQPTFCLHGKSPHWQRITRVTHVLQTAPCALSHLERQRRGNAVRPAVRAAPDTSRHQTRAGRYVDPPPALAVTANLDVRHVRLPCGLLSTTLDASAGTATCSPCTSIPVRFRPQRAPELDAIHCASDSEIAGGDDDITPGDARTDPARTRMALRASSNLELKALCGQRTDRSPSYKRTASVRSRAENGKPKVRT